MKILSFILSTIGIFGAFMYGNIWEEYQNLIGNMYIRFFISILIWIGIFYLIDTGYKIKAEELK
jgi:hypothetical protein